MNSYAYAGGNPLSYVDPLGLWSMSLGGYAGVGAEIIFGSENGHRFLTARLGFGDGIVAEFDPRGGVPGGRELTECHSGLVLAGSIKGGDWDLGHFLTRRVNSVPSIMYSLTCKIGITRGTQSFWILILKESRKTRDFISVFPAVCK